VAVNVHNVSNVRQVETYTAAPLVAVNVHNVSNVRQVETYTAAPLVAGPSN
jgi:hypothetical protein